MSVFKRNQSYSSFRRSKKTKNYVEKNYESRALPQKQEEREKRILGYIRDLVENYNNYVNHIGITILSLNTPIKYIILYSLVALRLRVSRALTAVGQKTNLSEKFASIDINRVFDSSIEDQVYRSEIFIAAGTSAA